MSKNVEKWKYMLDKINCHPELREQVADKLQKHLENMEILSKEGKFNAREFGKKMIEITKPYDRRKNTLR